jgi:epoxyqueuosine reductase
MPEAAGVICLAASYAPGEEAVGQPGHVALYARGRNYHRLLKDRCGKIVKALRAMAPSVRAKICADVVPLSERDMAARAGLGWIGRNGCLIHPRHGSYLVLCEIITNLPLPPGNKMPSGCGECRRCVDACPTGALQADGLVDCRKCVSYLTLEHRGAIDASLWPKIGECLAGCDACQRACPFNADAPPGEPALRQARPLPTPTEVLAWTREDWDARTRGSSLRRADHAMLLRNAAIVVGNMRRGGRER